MKATHQGSCQICGREQKLPKGRLSLHGYTTRWGFFNGICSGSKELPFEQSIDLIDQRIAECELEIMTLSARSAELKAGVVDGTKAMVHARVYRNRYEADYVWQNVEIVLEPSYFSDSRNAQMYHATYLGETRTGEKKMLAALNNENFPNLYEAQVHLNTNYAVYRLDAHVKQLQQYITWQRERIANWKPTPLKEVA